MTGRSDQAVFELGGPLPGVGTTVLEASAGTGKTFAVACLATRYVAEAVVSARRAARDHLQPGRHAGAARPRARDVRRDRRRTGATRRTRGRRRGRRAHPCSRRDAAGRGGDPANVAQRLLDAVANYDAATIATTHEFCNAVLRSLGVAGDSDSTELLREDICATRRGGGRGPLPRPLRPAPARRRRSTFRAARNGRHAAAGQPARALRPLGLSAESEGGALVSLRRAACAPSSRCASAGPASSPTTTCCPVCAARSSPSWLGRRAADAGALGRGAGRRVPGHRPGAVGGAASTPSPNTPGWC